MLDGSHRVVDLGPGRQDGSSQTQIVLKCLGIASFPSSGYIISMSDRLVSPLCLLGLLSTSELSVEVGGFMGRRCLPPRSLVRGNKGLCVL